MSTLTLGSGRPLPSATWRTAGWLVSRTLRIVAVVAPLLLALVVGVVPGVMALLGVTAPGSLWSFTAVQAPGVFTLVIAAMTISHLAIHLAFGMTRRSFVAAVVVNVLVTALVLSFVVPLGYLLEAAHFRAYGWAHVMPEGLASAASTSLLRSAVWGFAGALSAAVWYRFGGFAGVVALPLTAVFPIVSTSMRIERTSSFGSGDVAVVVGTAAVLAAGYAVVVLGTAVKGRTA